MGRNGTIAAVLALLAAPEAYGQSGEFTPVVGDGSPFEQVHFFPKNGNKIVISGNQEIIPAGIGVISGGVIASYNDACIEMVCNQKLSGETLYRVFVNCGDVSDKCQMQLNFSTAGHIEDPITGVEVSERDSSQTLVGMVFTDANGMFIGEADRQLTISWANRGFTGLVAWIGQYGRPAATSCSSTPEIVGPTIEFLTFGINTAFPQAFTIPAIQVAGSVKNDTVGGAVAIQVAVQHAGIDGFVPFGHLGMYRQSTPDDVGVVGSVAIGGLGAEEGLVRARIALSNAGTVGCATLISGSLWIDSLWS